MQIEEPVDIFLSHDWPLGVTDHGNWKGLVRQKPHFEQEVIVSEPQCSSVFQSLENMLLRILKSSPFGIFSL